MKLSTDLSKLKETINKEYIFQSLTFVFHRPFNRNFRCPEQGCCGCEERWVRWSVNCSLHLTGAPRTSWNILCQHEWVSCLMILCCLVSRKNQYNNCYCCICPGLSKIMIIISQKDAKIIGWVKTSFIFCCPVTVSINIIWNFNYILNADIF